MLQPACTERGPLVMDEAFSNPSLKATHLPAENDEIMQTKGRDLESISLREVIIEIVDHILSGI